MEILKIVFPLVVSGVAVVILIKYVKRKVKQKACDKNIVEPENYMAEGVAWGLCLGGAFGVLIDPNNITQWASGAMLLGLVIGMNIKRD